MSVEGDLHAALMARVGTLSGFDVVYPRKGADQPEGEHVRVSFLPNDNLPAYLDTDQRERRGFLFLTLVSPLGEYQAASENSAGNILAHFPMSLRLTQNGTTVECVNGTVRPAREVAGRWETPVRIEYRGIA